MSSLPLSFIQNRRRLDPEVAYYVHGSTTTLYFTADGLTVRLAQKRPLPDPESPAALLPSPGHVLKVEFLGANPVRPVGRDLLPGVVSYFTGPEEDWVTGLPTFSSIAYPDLWPGIDLVYSGTGSLLKYTFHVAPGADPTAIRLAYRGATGLEVNETGALEVATPLTTLTEQAPYSYQDSGGRREVQSSYKLNPTTGTFGFNLGFYDPTQPLVIDPVVVVYAGYIGGSGDDFGRGVAVDDAGSTYVTGQTSSNQGFPVKVGPDLTYNGGFGDAFVAKVEASGQGLVYAGYIGGAEGEDGTAVAVDGAGSAYVTGVTLSDEDSFPVKAGPDVTYNGGLYDAFVAKVEASGEALAYAGYIGGSRDDFGGGIAVDGTGSAYVAGGTTSLENSFPVTVGPDLTHNGDFDAFVAKVDASGQSLAYAGYIGGAGYDSGESMAVDEAGIAYVVGRTTSSQDSFPVTVGPDLTHNGGFDAFVAKVGASGQSLAYAGYIGGTGTDYGLGVAVYGAGSAYVSGLTGSDEDSFPVKVGPDVTHNGGVDDAFVAKVDSSGETLAYAGYIGGSRGDFGASVAVDGAGSAYVTGSTGSSEDSFPVTVGPDLTYNGGLSDAFVAKVDVSGQSLVYAGYIGGADDDVSRGVAVDGAGGAYVTGYTTSSQDSFPVMVGPDLTYNGGFDAFAAKISSDEEPGPVCTISGTSGHDTIEGTGADDVICSQAGNDTVFGRTGDDTALGGAGHDTLVGGRGSDILRGGLGDDVLRTSDGIAANDHAWGGPGSDVCVIDAGDETNGCDEIQVRPVASGS